MTSWQVPDCITQPTFDNRRIEFHDDSEPHVRQFESTEHFFGMEASLESFGNQPFIFNLAPLCSDITFYSPEELIQFADYMRSVVPDWLERCASQWQATLVSQAGQ